jgi:hypothetical protein
VNEEIKEDLLIKSRCIKANVRLDGFNYKMRLRKEESVVKVIDFAIKFTEKKNSKAADYQNLSIALTDFQVLHQNNELIFKHCSNYMEKQDLSEGEDKSLNMPGEIKIWSLKMNKNENVIRIETKLENFLIIFESKAFLQIL